MCGTCKYNIQDNVAVAEVVVAQFWTEDIGLNGRDINNKEEEEEGRLEGRQCKNICRVYNPKNTGMKVIEQGRFIDGMRELGP